MAALVRQHPQAGSEQSLNEGINAPQRSASGCRRDVLGGDTVVEDIEGRS